MPCVLFLTLPSLFNSAASFRIKSAAWSDIFLPTRTKRRGAEKVTGRDNTWLGDLRDAASVNDGEPWSDMDIAELKNAIEYGETIAEAAEFLCRSTEEVAIKAKDLGLSTTRH